jgi:hypothetical protein
MLSVSIALVALLAGGVWLSSRSAGDKPADHGSVLLIGDSLNVGIEPYLRDALAGWTIGTDDVVGRSTDAGLAALSLRRAPRGAVVISLGTNDTPGDVTHFRDDVDKAVGLVGRGSCVIWATIWRDGRASEGFNAVLRETAQKWSNVRLLDWATMLEEHPDWVAPDGTHGSPEGYQARAEETARLVRSCAVSA